MLGSNTSAPLILRLVTIKLPRDRAVKVELTYGGVEGCWKDHLV